MMLAVTIPKIMCILALCGSGYLVWETWDDDTPIERFLNAIGGFLGSCLCMAAVSCLCMAAVAGIACGLAWTIGVIK